MTQLKDYKIIKEYKDILKRLVPLNIPTLDEDEIERALDYSIEKRANNPSLNFINNYVHAKVTSSVLEFTEYLIDRKPIMTPYGVIFSRHGTVPNPLYDMIDGFVTTRAKFKDKMFEYVPGSEEFNKYNLLQQVAKVDVNAIYGAIGAPSSIFYNIYCAGGVTSAGRGAISASITMFESMLEDNVQFGSLNEVMTFIDNVCQESSNRIYKDFDVLDENIYLEQVFSKIVLECGYNWIPSQRELELIWESLSRVSQENLNRMFYKNNLYSFCNNKFVSEKIIDILASLSAPFLNPNKPPKEIKDKLESLLSLIKEYVYYGYIYIDKLDRIETMIREVVLITDTDSCIISFEHWFQFVNKLIRGIDIRIRHDSIEIVKRTNCDEFGNYDLIPVIYRDDPAYDFDFANDKLVESQRLINVAYTSPSDGLRHSIINIMAFCIGKLILDYMVVYTKHYHSWDKERQCMLIMKNEFLFKSILLTNGKKNYAAINEVQEGHLVPSDKSLHIAGLPLDKVGIPKSTSNELKRILHDECLDVEDIDQMKILKELAVLQKQIFESLTNGETKYYKPARIKSMNVYETPMRIQGIKAAVAYNALKDDAEEAINLEQSNTVMIIKTNIDKKEIEKSKDDSPLFYERVKKVLSMEEFKGGISTIAVLSGNPIPKWIIPYINYTEIVHDNLNSFPLESLGFNRFDNKYITFSNILNL